MTSASLKWQVSDSDCSSGFQLETWQWGWGGARVKAELRPQTASQMWSGDSQQAAGPMTRTLSSACELCALAGSSNLSFKTTPLSAGSVMSGQGSLLHVESRTHEWCGAECELFSEGKQFAKAKFWELQRNRVSLWGVCSADICPIFSPFCLPCFYNASLGSCSKISFSTAGVTKPRQSPALLSVRGGKISLFPPFDFELVLTRNKVRWNVTVFLTMFPFFCEENTDRSFLQVHEAHSFFRRLESKQKWP